MNRIKVLLVIALSAAAAVATGVPAPSNIDPASKFSWGENIGWMNWRDADGAAQGVFVSSDHLAGYIWSENVGWINVGPGGGPYANATGLDFGVNVLPNGDLDGNAWGENAGWFNFGWGAGSSDPGRARFDTANNRFRGYAWGENVGWVNLDDDEHFVAVEGAAADTPLPAGPPHDRRKNRFISFAPNNAEAVAFRVELLDQVCSITGRKCSYESDCRRCVGGTANGDPCSINSDCPGGGTCQVSGETCDEQSAPVVLGWVGDPIVDPGESPPGTVTARVVSSMPAVRVWTESPVHVGDCEIAPVQSYALSATTDGSIFSDPLVLATIDKPQGKFWADIVGSFDGTTWSAPNYLVNVDDVVAWVKYVTLKPAPHVTVVDLDGETPNFIINATDLQFILAGFRGETYPPPSFSNQGPPVDCP